MTFNWFQMLFRLFCIISVQDLYGARPYLFCLFFCVDMTFNWFQMLFRVFCIVSVQDLYALEQFQSTRQQQQLRENQV